MRVLAQKQNVPLQQRPLQVLSMSANAAVVGQPTATGAYWQPTFGAGCEPRAGADDSDAQAFQQRNLGRNPSRDFSRIAVHTTPRPILQAKLMVNSPGDVYEQEADRVAEQVMRMPEPGLTAAQAESRSFRGVQRACACGGSCADCQKKKSTNKSGRLQMKSVSASDLGQMEAPPIVHEVLRSPGQPLDAATRAFMEPRFGYDFSGVRIRSDRNSANAVGSRAYTVGPEIVFASGEYAPATIEGERLIAHELVHVVQQVAAPASPRIGGHAAQPRYRSSPAALLQRFPEPGHKMIGDEAFGSELLTLGPGLQVTFGDAVAMGDYFGSFEEMRSLAKKEGMGVGRQGEVRYVLWVKIRQKPEKERLGVWYDKFAAQRANQRDRYLAGTNVSHFPNPLAGDSALSPQQKSERQEQHEPLGAAATYRQAHEEAMRLAYGHGLKREAMEDALLADAFACHFLTDSFSASHIRTARAGIKDWWNKRVPGFHHKLIQWLGDQIDHNSWRGFWGEIKRGLAFLPLLPGAPGESVRAAVVEELSIALNGLDFGDVVSLIVHDAEGAATVNATVGGERITLVGDKDLVTDEIDPVTRDHTHKLTGNAAKGTFDAAVRAVKASTEDLYAAHSAGFHGEKFSAAYGKTVGPDRLYAAERLVPTPVADSLLPREKRSLFWMQNSLDDFLADGDIRGALKTWGPIAADTFTEKLSEMRDRGDLPPGVFGAIQRVLIVPLASGNPDTIGAIFRAIVARH